MVWKLEWKIVNVFKPGCATEITIEIFIERQLLFSLALQLFISPTSKIISYLPDIKILPVYLRTLYYLRSFSNDYKTKQNLCICMVTDESKRATRGDRLKIVLGIRSHRSRFADNCKERWCHWARYGVGVRVLNFLKLSIRNLRRIEALHGEMVFNTSYTSFVYD